jgi:hypothetical protein
MQVKAFDAYHASLRLSRDELATISQGLNEVCYGLRVVNFSSKMGAERLEVGHLIDQTVSIYYSMKKSRSRYGIMRLSARELLAIIGALKEVLLEIDAIEFATRMGAEISEVEQILNQVTPIYSKMNQLGSSTPPKS